MFAKYTLERGNGMKTILTEHWIDYGKRKSKDFQVEGFLVGEGALQPKFLMIGEAPGETEVETNQPFSGRSGKGLDSFLDSIQCSRDEIYISSAFKSRPYKIKNKINKKTGMTVKKKYNRTPTKKEIKAHAPILDYEIEALDPPFILLMGNIALQRFVDSKGKVGDYHGKLITTPLKYLPKEDSTKYSYTDKSYKVFVTYHPSSILYRRTLEDTVYEDYKKFGKILKG